MVNPFSKVSPLILKDLKGVHWEKGGLSLLLFKVLFNTQILISLLSFNLTLGFLVWTPFRMFLSLGFLSLLWKLPLLETLAQFIENYYIKLINTFYNATFPSTGWFGRKITKQILTPTPEIEAADLNKVAKAFIDLKNLPQLEKLSQFNTNLKWAFDNVLTSPLKNEYSYGTIGLFLIGIGLILGGFWVYSNHIDWFTIVWNPVWSSLQKVGNGILFIREPIVATVSAIWNLILHPINHYNHFFGGTHTVIDADTLNTALDAAITGDPTLPAYSQTQVLPD